MLECTDKVRVNVCTTSFQRLKTDDLSSSYIAVDTILFSRNVKVIVIGRISFIDVYAKLYNFDVRLRSFVVNKILLS